MYLKLKVNVYAYCIEVSSYKFQYGCNRTNMEPEIIVDQSKSFLTVNCITFIHYHVHDSLNITFYRDETCIQPNKNI